MAFSSFNSLQCNWHKNNVNVVKPYMMLAGGYQCDIVSSIDGGKIWKPVQNTITGDYFPFPIPQIGCFATNGTTIVCGGLVSWKTTTLAYSPDGKKWTSLGTSVFSSGCNCITYNPGVGMFVAGGAGTNSLAYSYDGINWTGSGTTVFTNVLGVAYIGTNWLACNNTGTHFLASSTDGINWTGIGKPSIMTTNIFDIASNNNLGSPMWVAVGQGTNTIMYSTVSLPNSNTVWTGVATSTSLFSIGLCITYSVNTWIACGNSNNYIATCLDTNMELWTGKRTTGTAPNRIASNGSNVVVTCGYGNSLGDNIIVSIDSGSTWSARGSVVPNGTAPNTAYGPGGGPMYSVAWIPQLSTFLIGSNSANNEIRGRNQYIISSLPLPINSAPLVGVARTLTGFINNGHPAITSNDSTILISCGGSNPNVISFDKGTTWTVPLLWSGIPLGGISAWCSGFKLFITFAANVNTSYYTSPTGETWTNYTSTQITYPNGFCSSDASDVTVPSGVVNTMVCTSSNTNLISTSTNGVNWVGFPRATAISGITLRRCDAICWIAHLNMFIAVGRTSGNMAYTLKSTNNGVTWEANAITGVTSSMAIPNHICWSPQQSRLVISGSAPYLMYSNDIGVTWTACTIAGLGGLSGYYSLTWNSSVNKWFVSGLGGGGLGTSINGITWTSYTPALITTANTPLNNIQTLSIST
jgi:hypothetical protein